MLNMAMLEGLSSPLSTMHLNRLRWKDLVKMQCKRYALKNIFSKMFVPFSSTRVKKNKNKNR